jgi:hypothetical protein
MAYGVRRYEGRVRNPSYQRNLFHAQPPVGRGCGGALAINSDDGATQQLPCSELLSHSACRWPLLPVMHHPNKLFLSAFSAARETDPGAATEF